MTRNPTTKAQAVSEFDRLTALLGPDASARRTAAEFGTRREADSIALRELDGRAREAIADFLIEELETDSADEILSETRDLYGDERYLANQTQAVFERAL